MQRILSMLIVCLLCLGAAHADVETVEYSPTPTMGGGGELCTGTIFDYSKAKPGDIIVRGYEETPEWAQKPFLNWLVYHHAAMIVEKNGKNSFETMEAYGSFPNSPEDEITKLSTDKSEWQKTMYSTNEGECIKIKHLRLLRVPEAKNNITNVIDYVLQQDNKRFHLGGYDEKSSKDNEEYFYCSKLVWKGYMKGAHIDIDDDGGFYVKPGDLVDDDDTITKMEFNS